MEIDYRGIADRLANGLCGCGCGQHSPIANRTRPHLGHVKGSPTPYLRGHGSKDRTLPGRKPWLEWSSALWISEDHGYKTPCWIWIGKTDPKGYGQFGSNAVGAVDGNRGRAHRIAYIKEHGAIPKKMVIDHLCVIPSCVNPSHLEAVTNGENIRRSYERKRAREYIMRSSSL